MDFTMIWVVLLVICVVVEIATMGLTTIWFAGGAFIALILAIIGLPSYVQIAAFLVVSLTLLFFTRPIAVRFFNKDRVKTNAESLVGEKARVLIPVNNLKSEGQVMVNGMEWTARSTKDEVTFVKDEMVRIVGISGVKLIIEKLNKEEEHE